MQKFKFLLIYILISHFLFVSCSSDVQNDVVEPINALNLFDVSYGANSQQAYDIYLPAGRSALKTKVIMLIHGGGWTSGDKSDMNDFVQFIQQSHPDHAIVNMNYVLADLTTAAFPHQFLDVQRVIEKLKQEKNELQILPEFALIGTSAGAHIALQYDYVYDISDDVKMVCDIVGPSDFTDPFFSEDPAFTILLSLLIDESAYPAGTNFIEEVSPAIRVSSMSSPSILFYGDADPLVPLTNGQRLQTALSNAGVTHSFTIYEGGHGDDWSETNILDLKSKISSFINTFLTVE